MHRPVGKFRYAYETHTIIHHRIFKADHTYHLINEKDKEKIPMEWWNGPVLIGLAASPFIVLSIIFKQWPLAAGGVAACAIYYGLYEYLHWCMHLPKNRRVEQPWIFRRLNGHHLLHHRYMGKNFNVVLPLADILLGTYIARAKTHFAQARGPAVPDVQPLEPLKPAASQA
jgi:sterol desaturase/sphingolipid hydroxylase (fatty acid hydroxylase superfamily)